ncbi:MAG: hypothetical protein L7F77_00825, partial [Candidatus Magnetominusculus sp. LBB02]|nr:hypothetical protein [Candidatus Magnetominusculus sp. LBB02]
MRKVISGLAMLQQRINRVALILAAVFLACALLTISKEASGAYGYYNDICGHTWNKMINSGKKYWWGIASSIDGTKLAAIEYNGYIYTSGDNGTTWTQQIVPGQRGWVSIASSSDGTKIAAVENDNLTDGGIWQGTFTGGAWSWSSTHAATNNYYMSVAMSADGGQVYAADYSGNVYSSAGHWTSHSAGVHNYSLATTSNGTNVYAGTVNGWFHYSFDNGTTFTASNQSTSAFGDLGYRYWWGISTGTSRGNGDIFAVDGDGGNVIALTFNVVGSQISTALSGKNITSVSYDNFYDDTGTTNDFVAVTDFGAGGTGGYLYTSSCSTGTSGVSFGSWNIEDTDNATGTAATTTPRMWSSVVVSNSNGSLGMQIAAAEYGGYIWTRTQKHPTYQVAVNKGTGTGKGIIYASSSNITWTGDNGSTDVFFPCPDYATLTAEPTDLSSTFDGWVGCDNTSGAKCTVRLVRPRSVQAVFGLSATDHKMIVSTSGTGTGTVTSSPTGIICGTNGTSCSSTFPDNYTVTLTASADNSSAIKSWTGCDWSSGSLCTVTLLSNRTVSAIFQSGSSTLSVTKSGTGTGTVSSSPSGISCGTTCTSTYATGATVILTATPDSGNSFSG